MNELIRVEFYDIWGRRRDYDYTLKLLHSRNGKCKWSKFPIHDNITLREGIDLERTCGKGKVLSPMKFVIEADIPEDAVVKGRIQIKLDRFDKGVVDIDPQ